MKQQQLFFVNKGFKVDPMKENCGKLTVNGRILLFPQVADGE